MEILFAQISVDLFLESRAMQQTISGDELKLFLGYH